ncbi:MAG: DUF456 domain-containing protein [Flavobacteriaceae bacterium]|nr:DUF456 domain-containing protein [Flavobacteriaceae bacterium]
MIEILLFGGAVFFILLGLAGSVLPIIPGPLSSWVGILLLYLTQAVPFDWRMIIITGLVAITIFILDLLLPIIGTKKYGGSKASIRGCTIGIIVGIIALGPLGLVFGPFLGALAGELIARKFSLTNFSPLKVAFGAVIGFLIGSFLKVVICVGFLIHFILITIKNWDTLV